MSGKHGTMHIILYSTPKVTVTGHYLWQGVAPKRNVFLGKNFTDPTIKKSNLFYPISSIN
jgi:hypothetical protein